MEVMVLMTLCSTSVLARTPPDCLPHWLCAQGSLPDGMYGKAKKSPARVKYKAKVFQVRQTKSPLLMLDVCCVRIKQLVFLL